MNFKKSRNPFMNQFESKGATRSNHEVLDRDLVQNNPIDRAYGDVMTSNGAVNKSFILAGILLMTAIFAYAYANPIFIMGGAIVGLIVVLVAVFKPHLSPILAPIYAGVEGLFVGALSAQFAYVYDGIVFQAVTLTMAVLFVMLAIHKSGLIPVTQKFRRGVVMATFGIFFVYILNWILSFFGINMPYLHEGGMVGMGISLLIIGVASLNLLLDFDNFEKGEQSGAPKYMEWFFAMGLIITLVWLYVEILRFLAIFAGED